MTTVFTHLIKLLSFFILIIVLYWIMGTRLYCTELRCRLWNFTQSITDYMLCNVLNLDCWTETKNAHGPDGTPYNFTILDECQAACINISACVAIDWEPINAGKTCWILTSTLIKDTTHTGVITHYELRRPCPS